MKETILLMINQAEIEENYSLIGYVKQIIDTLATTINCPSDWRDIGSQLTEIYQPHDWVYEELELWNHEM